MGEWEEGQSCGFQGCLSNISRPCESCGRVAGSWELTAKYWKDRHETLLLSVSPKGFGKGEGHAQDQSGL